MAPQPRSFSLSVPDAAIADLRERLARTRLPDQAPGAPWALCITPGANQFLYVADAYPGRIYKLTLDGKVLGVLGESGRQLKQFGWVHEIACPNENTLFVAEIITWRIQKLLLHPEQAKKQASR